jgi:hypothetical protein
MLDAVSHKTREEIQIQCEMEKRRPLTMNEHYFVRCKGDKYTKLVNLRRPLRTSRTESHSVSSNVPIRSLTKQELVVLLVANGFPFKSVEHSARLYDPDEYEEELRVISEVLA